MSRRLSETGRGMLKIRSNVLLPPGQTIAGATQSLAGPATKGLLTASLAETNVTSIVGGAISSDAIRLRIGASARADCRAEGTRYEPSIASAGSSWAPNASVCQERCATTKGCAYFTYWRHDKDCLLQNGSAKPLQDLNTTAGPRSCQRPPASDEPSIVGSQVSSITNWVKEKPETLILPGAAFCLLPIVLLLVCMVWKRRKRRRRAPDSGIYGKSPDYHAVPNDASHDYSPLNRGASPATRDQQPPLAHAPRTAMWLPEPADEVQSWAAQCESTLTTGRYAAAQGAGAQSGIPVFLHPEDTRSGAGQAAQSRNGQTGAAGHRSSNLPW